MSTTIQVKEKNLRLLSMLKKETGAKSYDAVIEKLLEEKFGITDDLFGIDRDRISKFREADRLEDQNVDL